MVKAAQSNKIQNLSPMNERNEWRCHYLSCLLQLNMAGQLHVLTIKRYICMVVFIFRWVNYIDCINRRSACPGDRFTPNRQKILICSRIASNNLSILKWQNCWQSYIGTCDGMSPGITHSTLAAYCLLFSLVISWRWGVFKYRISCNSRYHI